jgi:hypothetical protein
MRANKVRNGFYVADTDVSSMHIMRQQAGQESLYISRMFLIPPPLQSAPRGAFYCLTTKSAEAFQMKFRSARTATSRARAHI